MKVIQSMILGMIRQFMVPLLLVGAASAQSNQPLKVKIVLPEGRSEKASINYEPHDRVSGKSFRHLNVSLRAGHTIVEVPATTDRFKALVWVPGCKMKDFDIPIAKSDIELQFACDPLSTVPFHGRVTGVEVGVSARISASYDAAWICMWLDGAEKSWAGSCMGPQIGGIAIAPVAPDGTFSMELPDFRDDPFVGGESNAEIEFRIGGLKDHFILQPQPADGVETKAISIGVARSYPAEVTFLAVPLEEFFESKTQ
jgi:hypothetical protein